MSQEPSYPADAVPGRIVDPVEGLPAAIHPAPMTEAQGAGVTASDPSRTRRWQAGVAIGIGSAAIAAALLYANRPKRD